ncbi:hypothetical protein B0H10DRAFT_1998958 [Mycena sp. CBHHK59/15]|nr:hypothetical protein B0H10DRAFT_1998958 [Mycena sp. CBHHK59/15]
MVGWMVACEVGHNVRRLVIARCLFTTTGNAAGANCSDFRAVGVEGRVQFVQLHSTKSKMSRRGTQIGNIVVVGSACRISASAREASIHSPPSPTLCIFIIQQCGKKCDRGEHRELLLRHPELRRTTRFLPAECARAEVGHEQSMTRTPGWAVARDWRRKDSGLVSRAPAPGSVKSRCGRRGGPRSVLLSREMRNLGHDAPQSRSLLHPTPMHTELRQSFSAYGCGNDRCVGPWGRCAAPVACWLRTIVEEGVCETHTPEARRATRSR